MGKSALSNDDIHRIYDAAIAVGLSRHQDALLAGLPPAFVASLPQDHASGAQLFSTLHTLNTATLADGTLPLRVWLTNAVKLAGGRAEQRVFEQALADAGWGAPPPKGGSASGQHAAAGVVPGSPRPQKLFVSYSHADKEWLERLRVHLKPLDRAGKIDFWDDTRIPHGAKWRQEIQKALDAASIAVLLVSADFLASDFVASEELPKLLHAEAQRGLRVIPIIVGPCLFNDMPALSEFQAANPPDKPLSSMSKHAQDEVFLRVAQAIGKP
jgi:Effector-associated domain 5/TIR domain